MKFLFLIPAGLMFITHVYAGRLSPCMSACFISKQACNANASHTFNSCDPDLFACKASCMTGKKHETYTSTNFPLKIAVKPLLKFE